MISIIICTEYATGEQPPSIAELANEWRDQSQAEYKSYFIESKQSEPEIETVRRSPIPKSEFKSSIQPAGIISKIGKYPSGFV